eukprot:15172068-Alexandrium_andersonii.AAC.1
MSASLVGSEMCIRDRPRAARLPSRPRSGRPRWQRACTRVAAEKPSHSRVSVSYTHLTLPTICSV